MSSSELDKAFELIEEGNTLKKSGEHWKAADAFGQAMIFLEKLADEAPSATQDEKKIQELYQAKRRYYLQTARESLIQALQTEKEQDSQSDDGEIIATTVSNEQAESRIRTFSLLFSKNVEDVGEKTNLLEERLMELNASLPSGFKTDKERMADINRGLGRLGLTLYPNSEHGSSKDIQPPPSEEDQVAQIIAQAKDEVQYETKPTTSVKGDKKNETEASANTSVDDDTSESEDSEDSISMDDIVDTPVLKNQKVIRRKVVKAQVKLAELIALLNIEPDINLSDDTGIENDGDENDEGEQDKAGFNLEYGKATLIAARNYLNRALKEWPDEAS